MTSLNAPKGLIRPPPDIRAIVDKTAAFIGKMGDEFEARIQSQSGGDVSKFRFLNPSDPYHAYYKHKVLEARTGTSSSTTTTATTTTTSAQSVSSSSSSSSISTTKSAATVEVVSNEHVSNTNNVVDVDSDQNQNSRKPPTIVEESNAQSVDNSNQSINPSSSSSSSSSSNMSVSVSAVLPNPLARALKTFESLSLAATSAPKPFYSVLTPIGITAAAADRIKLTAEFTATGGRRFLASLTSKEFNNPEFDFLRPSHAHFSYYTALVDAFAKVLTPPSSVVSKVEALADDSSSSYSFLESVVHEAEWMRLEEEKKRKEEDVNASSAVQIDWHSFVVVETVELKDFVFEKEGWEGSGSRGINGGSIQQPGEEEEGDGDMDVEEEKEEEEMEVDTNEDGNEEFLNIRMDYIPSDQSTSTTTGLRESPSRSIHHASSSSGGGGGEVFLDPISGLSIPIDRANEHIKAQMLDPQAKQNRLRFEAKQSKTLFTTGEDVASNLKNLIGKKSADDGKTVSSLSNTKSTPIVEIGVEMPPTAKNGPAQKRPRTSDN